MAIAAKLDMRKDLKALYGVPSHPVLVQVPPLRYLMLDGAVAAGKAGPGEDPAFQEAVQALYTVSYSLKFAAKAAGRDYAVMPLEGLFWTEGTVELRLEAPASMCWTLMILQPPWLTPAEVDSEMTQAVSKGKLPRPAPVRLETLDEGHAAQILHLGPYAAEPATISRLHAFIDEQGLVRRGKHHEIYLSDPNRTAPERLKTLIRQPVGGKAP